MTGLSGSGKSSLAFDTIFAEGQRRYVESLSAYARQFLNQMQKPDVDEITGLSPAISIDQKSAGIEWPIGTRRSDEPETLRQVVHWHVPRPRRQPLQRPTIPW